mmetsp:Transcript_30651/g.96706  ORF Transcript_30651/g.96706 Transcript_30651/m.96706 type:complete len:241 (+) Transcript_30651:156-878(+)
MRPILLRRLLLLLLSAPLLRPVPPLDLATALAPLRVAFAGLRSRLQRRLPVFEDEGSPPGPAEVLAPCLVRLQRLRVSHDDEAVPCASQRHVGAPRVAQETAAASLVGAHAREDHDVLLAALKRVDRVALDGARQPPAQQSRLARVEGDHTDRLEAHAARAQPVDDGDDGLHLTRVAVRLSVARLARADVEEGGRRGSGGPREGGGRLAARGGLRSDEGRLVKEAGRELCDGGVHPILRR